MTLEMVAERCEDDWRFWWEIDGLTLDEVRRLPDGDLRRQELAEWVAKAAVR